MKQAGTVWVPWKRVRTVPSTAEPFVTLSLGSGDFARLLFDKDSPYPAFYATVEDDPAGPVRVGMLPLVSGVVGAIAREVDRWTALERDPRDDLEVYGNEQLTVIVRRPDPLCASISYHWRDRAPIRDWRIGQRVKNEVAGPEWEAVELYPAESRLMDEANEYWLWAFHPDHPLYGLVHDLGHQERTVLTQEDLAASEAPESSTRDPGDEILR